MPVRLGAKKFSVLRVSVLSIFLHKQRIICEAKHGVCDALRRVRLDQNAHVSVVEHFRYASMGCASLM